LRLEGYRSALAAAGLPQSDELVAPALNYHRREGAEAMAHLLSLPEPPDAVFCFNDLLAIGALRAATERGFRVPADIAIVGFDNTEESAYSLPSLTTIAPDKTAIAQTAVDLIRRRSEPGEPFALQDVQTPFSLEIRESTGA
jgi:DNA-binding LacI/PurR family transcriptional regulator